jgi:hypothetical protein
MMRAIIINPILIFNSEWGSSTTGINYGSVKGSTRFSHKGYSFGVFKLEDIRLEAEKLPPFIMT